MLSLLLFVVDYVAVAVVVVVEVTGIFKFWLLFIFWR